MSDIFDPSYCLPETHIVIRNSPSSCLEICRFRKDGEERSRGIIHCFDRAIYIYRNCGDFPHAFVNDHPNGTNYLVVAESPSCPSVIDMQSGIRRSYPNEIWEWHDWTISEDRRWLAVEGSFEDCDMDLKIFNFSNPLYNLPERYSFDHCLSIRSHRWEGNGLYLIGDCEYNLWKSKYDFQMTHQEYKDHIASNYREERTIEAIYSPDNNTMQIVDWMEKSFALGTS